MKQHRPFRMIVPETILREVTARLKQSAPALLNKQNDFACLLSYLFHNENVQQAKIEKNKKKPVDKQDKNLNEWYPINSRYLKRILATKSNGSKYINFLIETGILETDNDSKPGVKSKYYRLNPSFKRDIGIHLVEPGTRQFDKMYTKYNNRKAHYNWLLPHLAEMKDKIHNMEFDVEGARECIAQCSDLTKQYFLTSQLESLADDRQRLFRRKYNKGRLYTSLTSLKKDLRQFVVGDFVQIEVINSQPFLLNQLITHLFKHYTWMVGKNSLPLLCKFCGYDLIEIFGVKTLKKVLLYHNCAFKELLVKCKDFARSVNTGMLYDDMAMLFKKHGYECTRDDMKELMHTVICNRNEIELKYGKFVPYKKEIKLFYKAYPVIARTVDLLKSRNNERNTSLAVLLQNIESEIIIDTAAGELAEAGTVAYTLHDAVIVEREYQQKAEEIIGDVYRRFFGVAPTLKVENFGSGKQSEALQQKIA